MLNFVITLKDILDQDLVITEINNEKIDGMGKVSYDNDNNLILTIHHPNQPIQNYDVKKFDIIAKIAKHQKDSYVFPGLPSSSFQNCQKEVPGLFPL